MATPTNRLASRGLMSESHRQAPRAALFLGDVDVPGGGFSTMRIIQLEASV